MAEYINKESAMDAGTLYDWYISSVDETVPPVWTDKHIEELLKDFLIIPKDTPAADVAPVVHGRWVNFYDETYGEHCICSICNNINSIEILYCPDCGAKMDGKDDESKRR